MVTRNKWARNIISVNTKKAFDEIGNWRRQFKYEKKIIYQKIHCRRHNIKAASIKIKN